MLSITIPATELWDEKQESFVSVKGQTLRLEHSLVSLSKWESKHQKSFISNKDKTAEEVLDYVKCMTITQNVDPIVYRCLTQENVDAINEYIAMPMTAVYFPDDKNGNKVSGDKVTSELIYYWMITQNIPFECEKWHLNKLIALIRVCSMKNAPQKSMSKNDIYNRNRALNAARKKQHNTKG